MKFDCNLCVFVMFEIKENLFYLFTGDQFQKWKNPQELAYTVNIGKKNQNM